MGHAARQGCSPLCNALLTATVPWGGTYTILLWLSDRQRLRIGRLGCFVFPRGYYTYTGSARRGLASRLHRHIHGTTTRHWHIDYLRPYVRVLDWQTYAEGVQPECRLNRSLMAAGRFIVPRFGSSDCRCPSHLLHFDTARRPPWQIAASAWDNSAIFTSPMTLVRAPIKSNTGHNSACLLNFPDTCNHLNS